MYQRTGRPGWWISYTDARGRRRRKARGAFTRQQARAAHSAGVVAPPSSETFPGVAARYLAHQKAQITTGAYERARGIVETHLKPFHGGAKIGDMRRADVQRHVTLRSGAESPGSVAREINVLKLFLSFCVEWQLMVLNPASGIKTPRVPKGRVRYPHPGELNVLKDARPIWLCPIVGLAVATGMRRGEILGLRWVDVDRTSGRCQAMDKVFRQARGAKVSVAFRPAAARTGIEDFRFHDLRHHAASWLRMQGADIHTVAQLLGHKDLRMAARYQHLSPEFLSEAVKKLGWVFSPTGMLSPPGARVKFVHQRHRSVTRAEGRKASL